MDSTTINLNNSLSQPKVGYGTYLINDVEDLVQVIKNGYRHLDTAVMYKNETEVG